MAIFAADLYRCIDSVDEYVCNTLLRNYYLTK